MYKNIIKYLIILFYCWFLLSCSLSIFDTDYYFWELAKDYEDLNKNAAESEEIPIEIDITNTTLFVMTRGENDGDNPGYSTKAEALNKLEFTRFSLEEIDNTIIFEAVDNKIVKDLGIKDYHIYQKFSLNNFSKDTIYKINGKTIDTSTEDELIEDVTIKIKFK